VRVRDSHEPGEGKDQLPVSHTQGHTLRRARSRQMCLCRRESKTNCHSPERARGAGWVAAELPVSARTCRVVGRASAVSEGKTTDVNETG